MSIGLKSLAAGALIVLAIAAPAASSFAQDAPVPTQNRRAPGAVFAMTNRARNNEVIAFSRAANGRLTETGRFSTGGSGIGVDFDTQHGLVLSPDHRYLYAANPGSDDVSVFRVEGSELDLIQSVYAGDEPLSIARFGNLLYVLDGSVAGNQITGFTVATNGTLTPLPNSNKALSSPIAVPGDIVFSPDGSELLVTQKVASTIGFTIDVFRIGADGLPSDPVPNQSSGPRPFSAAFDTAGRLFVVESGLPVFNNAGVSSYTLNPSASALVPITGSAKNGQTDGCWIVITENQRYAYTANFISGTIASYRIFSNGTVALINGVAAPEGDKSQPTDLAFSTGSRYLYNLLRGTGGVAAYRVEGNGSLTAIGVFGVGLGLPINNGASGLAAY
ncbi:MAG: lactonase family protein [Pseudomonadota bacterium]|nr:lactonase family protein [Pseudomonadota bacterium]